MCRNSAGKQTITEGAQTEMLGNELNTSIYPACWNDINKYISKRVNKET